jgi:hypothetical protein
MRPDSFDDDRRLEWGVWVLDHGLPELPAELVEGQQVPVARWAGAEFGAVLLVGTCSHDRYCKPELHLATDMIRYRRAADSWQPARVSGGTDWHNTSTALPRVDPSSVDFFDSHHGGSSGWDCLAVSGLVGTEAAWIELTENDTVTRTPIEAPTGAFVVACTRPATIAVLTADGIEIGRETWA